MKRQADWEDLWQEQAGMAGADRWAPWLAIAAAVGVAIVGSF